MAIKVTRHDNVMEDVFQRIYEKQRKQREYLEETIKIRKEREAKNENKCIHRGKTNTKSDL